LKPRAAALLVVLGIGTPGCVARRPEPDPARMALLKQTYDHLHARLEKAAAGEALLNSVFAEKAQIVIAIRSGLVEELAGNVAHRYLDRVTVDLTDLDAHGEGSLRKKTFLGRIKAGEWNVDVNIQDLVGNLKAGTPRIGLRPPDMIDVDVPVEIQPTEGAATLHFGWDSKGVANVVCNDFELTREIRGRVLRQTHSLSGGMRLANTGETLTATPVFLERKVPLRLDLTPQSWAVVEAALRSQDTFGRCGMLMDPDKGIVKLKALADRGIKIKLPDSIFRTVSLPANVRKSVRVNNRTVELAVKARSLRIETATLWSSASVEVQHDPSPSPTAPASSSPAPAAR
jgi:hypothetical protein